MTSILSYVDVLSADQIASLFALDAVQTAKQAIDAQSSGSVYFSVPLSDSIKAALLEKLGLDLSHVSSVPMRWMKGDTAPHVDTGAAAFDNTYLLYLTDSDGSLVVDGQSYPISQGSAYVFPESLKHETRSTGLVPRLLLGPMSEAGFAVGYAFSFPGGTTVYVRQTTDIEWSTDQTTWYGFGNNYPIFLSNDNTSLGVVKVEFLTDITFDNSGGNGTSKYFICNTSHLQFGSTSLKTDGTRPIITIDGLTGYPGFIQNGSSGANGQSNIYVYNLEVRTANGSTLADKGGWICQKQFAKGVNNNYIVNCSSTGLIGSNSSEGGGIVGSYVASDGGELTIIGCSSSGNIGINSGGIVGTYACNTGASPSPSNGGTVNCQSCWSTGSILGYVGGTNGSGGIFGEYAGDNGIATATDCYSTGSINSQCGGIYARFAGRSGLAAATNCYSQGNIGASGGGIYAHYAGPTGGTTTATNCYSAGTVTTTGTGIYGSNKLNGTETSCYVANGNWSSVAANSSLTGTPSSVVGTTWVFTGTGQPYELYNMGYTPYTIANIDTSSTPALKRSISSSVVVGNSTEAAIVSGRSYYILEITGSGSQVSISINSTTGVISVGSLTDIGTYTIYVRNTGSYNITQYILTVTSGGGGGGGGNEGVACCIKPLFLGKTVDNTMRSELIAGNVLVANVRRGPISHAELLARKKANASKR